MMPLFPPPPLSFRTAGFPRYGWKAGFSDRAFPYVRSVKPAPGMPSRPDGLPLSFAQPAVRPGCPVRCRASDSVLRHHARALRPLPQGASLRSGLCCPGPSPLIAPIRPTRRHTAISPDRLICDAFAVRERLGDPRVVPSFRCPFLLDMSSSTTPGSPSAACAQIFFADDTGLRPVLRNSALPMVPPSASGGRNISGLPGSRFAATCRFACLLWRIRPSLRSADRDFYTQASGGWVGLPAAGYYYDGYWASPSMGLTPIGTSASFAAPRLGSGGRQLCRVGLVTHGVPMKVSATSYIAFSFPRLGLAHCRFSQIIMLCYHNIHRQDDL